MTTGLNSEPVRLCDWIETDTDTVLSGDHERTGH